MGLRRIQKHANCPNIRQSGLEMCLIGRYTIKINGKDVEVFYCDDFGEDCLNLDNNTKDEYIDWFNNIINYKKNKLTTNKQSNYIKFLIYNYNKNNNTNYILKDNIKLTQEDVELLVYNLNNNVLIEDYFIKSTRYEVEKNKLLYKFELENDKLYEIDLLFCYYDNNVYELNNTNLTKLDIIDLILYKKIF